MFLRIFTIFIFIFALFGCELNSDVALAPDQGLSGASDSGQSDLDPAVEPDEALLRSVRSQAELIEAVHQGFEHFSTNDGLALAGSDVATEEVSVANASSDVRTSTISQTYTLEAKVGEYDIVKYSDRRLFVAANRQRSFSLFDVVDTSSSVSPRIKLFTTDPAAASAEQTAEISLDGDDNIMGMYVVDDALVVLNSAFNFASHGADWLDISSWSQQTSGLKIYDVATDARALNLVFNMRIEGGFVDSRRLGDTVYVVTRHTPYRHGLVYYPANQAQAVAQAQVIAQLGLEDIVPKVKLNGRASDLFEAGSCYITNTKSENAYYGYPTITSITAVPINDPEAYKTFCYNEATVGLYMSEQAIYMANIRRNDGVRVTRIHKIAVDGVNLAYHGSAEVPGHVWSRGQLDFRLSEQDGALRVITTQWLDDVDDRLDHYLYVLKEDPVTATLNVIGQLPNAQRPEEIGKVNEDLYGIRFFKDRAYLVSFERIDPLYVIDLSDEHDPKIAGQLEIPGFSDFLHPIGAELLLGLGSDAAWNGQVKLELFDVRNIAKPISLSSLRLGVDGETTSTPAQYNRHAFTYLSGIDDVDRFAVPVFTTRSNAFDVSSSRTALHLFELRDKTNPDRASLQAVGQMAAQQDQNNYGYTADQRSVFHDDAVFYTVGGTVWSSFWHDAEQAQEAQ